MDFIVGLPNTSQKHDSVWVIIDRLTKTAHFIPVHTTYSAIGMQRFISIKLFVCMEFQRRSFLIVGLSLLHVSGSNCKNPLELN